MPNFSDLVTATDAEWKAAMPPFALARINEMLDAGSTIESVAETWLTEMGSRTVAPLGVGASKSAFYEAFKKEFRLFICGDPKYNADRTQLLSKTNAGKTLIVTTIASAIAPQIGAAAPLIVPPVCLFLIVVAKLSVNAWCSQEDVSKN